MSSTNFFHSVGGLSSVLREFFLKVLHINVFYNGTDWGTNGCPLHIFIILTLEEKMCAVEAKPQESYDMLDSEFCP